MLIFSVFTNLQAQEEVACLPDSIYQDSSAGAYPLPFNNGSGGLAMFPACINEPYELVFTLKLGDSISVAGIGGVDVISAQIETTGAISGLPEGLNYFCNPPDCIVPDSILGCIVITGTPTASNAAGDYELVITGGALLDVFGNFPLTFPGLIGMGSYALTLNEEGQCAPMSTGVNDYLSQQISLANTPNPVVQQTTIEMTSLLAGAFQFNVFDRTGRMVYQEAVQLNVGYNTLSYDASALEEGLYIYTLSDGTAVISEKMMVHRQ